MTRRPPPPVRVRSSHVEWVAERLSARDWEIIAAVNQLRLLTGRQIESLCFDKLRPGRSRIVSRSRVLQRLVAWRVLVPLPRRIGGAGRGSSAQCFALDSAGVHLARQRLLAEAHPPRVRRPGAATERTIRHTLAVSELYVRLTELGRATGFALAGFHAEPACWWPNGLGGYMKPDAYVVLARGDIRDHWWVEIDLATESVPTVQKKLLSYLDFLRRGQLGPGKVMPRVLVATIAAQRSAAITGLVKRLPPPAAALIHVVHIDEAAGYLYRVLSQ